MDRVPVSHGGTDEKRAQPGVQRHIVKRLQIMIDELSKRADENDLAPLLATSRRARLCDADLARARRGWPTQEGIEPASARAVCKSMMNPTKRHAASYQLQPCRTGG